MPLYSENKYLQSLIENLIATYETEVNYTPLNIELDPKQIAPNDIDTILQFVTEPRKRLFIFKIHDNEPASTRLAFIARRSVLDQTATTILQSTSNEPKIYPLKKALSTNSSSVRARIQIQKSFLLPMPPKAKKDVQHEHVEHIIREELSLAPINLPDLPELVGQLKALGLESIKDSAERIITEHAYAFKDGIIPSNLPTGFYINKEKKALCYTETPRKLPSGLAPTLKKNAELMLPSKEQIQELLPELPSDTLSLFMDTKYSIAQRNALTDLFPEYEGELKSLISLLKDNGTHSSTKPMGFIIPFLCKQFILGGEAHTILVVRLIQTCLNKKINLEFLKNSEVQNSLLSTRGIKNLQKLIHLPAEQKEWWNTLVTSHLNYDQKSFDFNVFFEAYTQIFLPRITEKNLTLPNPCPIEHTGHLLITLNRVLDVIEHAENPQEQCLSLSQLNWGATGVHYAMTQKPATEQFKQVASCMKLEKPEDTLTYPELIHQHIETETLELKPWMFRYMGQHWKADIRLSDIQGQLLEIEKLSFTSLQKNQLIFILTCTFKDKTKCTAEQWKTALASIMTSLQQLHSEDRDDLLLALTRCFKFKPGPSLAQINALVKQLIELKTAFPTKNFKNDFIEPMVSCLENEGFELLNILNERIQKTDPKPKENLFSLTVIASFTSALHKNHNALTPEFIKLLAKLDEPELNQSQIDQMLLALQNVQAKKGLPFSTIVLMALSQINISKSQPLPKLEQIQAVIETLANTHEAIPVDCKTPEKQETWLKDLILDKNLLPGCVLGNGDISKLDDLIVDALVDAIKKRSAALKIDSLKEALQTNLQSYIVPQQLRDQLNQELMPLFDAVNDLVTLLQSANPKFPEVIEKLKFFEARKPILLNVMYGVSLLGKTKGEYILSYLLTGKKKEIDNITGSAFAAILGQLHGLFISEMTAFFNDPQNKLIVKDLDLATSLSWMAAFNDTHSLTFFFKEELVQKKVLPALRKTLQQLNTQDLDFERSILDEASIISENAPSDTSLQTYKDKIESIANYLNLLIDINERLPQQFSKIYKQLNTGSLARFNYNQKQVLVSHLIKNKPDDLDLYLQLTTQALEENSTADSKALTRAINGLKELFELSDLEHETQIMFFKMSMAHNLKSSSPFPLAALNELKKSNLPEKTKSAIIKQIIQILTKLSGTDSSELVQGLVHKTQVFLLRNEDQAELCIALLKRVSQENPHHDLSASPMILHQLTQVNEDNRKKIARIVTGLALNKKDDTVNLFALLEITKGLGRRSAGDIDQVLKLFTTHPYPNTQSLNSALLAHGSENLSAYCLSFDTNPFAKTGGKRDLTKQFATDRVKEALLSLQDMLREEDLPHALQMKLAKQLTFIETLGYTDPLTPHDFKKLKKLTACSRHDLKERASTLLQQIRSKSIPEDQIEITYLELLAYLREIYFRTTGLFPNTTQILVLLLALHDPTSNLLMRIKTGEGKSINTPMLSVLQWSQGGTVDQCTANPTLLIRDFENNCEPFFKFLDIKTALIQSNSPPESYVLDGINCSTVEDMSIFRLAAKEAHKEQLLENDGQIHVVLDECDDALLDQVTLYKLVAELEHSENTENNPAQWIYPLAHQFINLQTFRNIDAKQGKIWDEDEDLEQFRLFLNKSINEQFNGNVDKQNYLMSCSNTQLKQWIHASCVAATLIENKHFIVQPIKEKDEAGHELTKKIICVPLIRSTPKTGSIFTEAVQQALQARLKAERKDQAHYYFIDEVPSVLASQSAQGLIKFYQNTKGRLLGISATPGDKRELESLATSIGTQAISVAPYAGDKRNNHEPIFTLNREGTFKAVHDTLKKIKCPITKPTMEINPDTAIQTYEEREALIAQTQSAIEEWSHTQTQPILIINEDFDEAKTLAASLEPYKKQGFKIQIINGKETPNELDRIIKQAGQVNTITVGTAMLAKGIDINTGDHPKGLFVIQTYTDTERMTTQIAGRAARNGKPGEWLPIYQIKPPEDLLNKFFYYAFPWRRQHINERTVEKVRNKLKSQATIDRLYTQAIDEAQQLLMQQIEAWESLLRELYPDGPKIQFEFYQWRETLLGELSRSQENSVTEQTLTSCIEHFKHSACKLWETAREEKWAAKAEKAAQITTEQNLRLKYLKQLDFAQELSIQTALQQKGKKFTAGVQELMHQNLETMIADKAGVVLDYTKPNGKEKKDLELAQSKQILPHLVAEFCSVYPEAMITLFPKNSSRNGSIIPDVISQFINKVTEKKNKGWYREEKQRLAESIILEYQKELMNADGEKIQELLSQLKPLILKHCKDLESLSLVEQFKMQGFILTFCTLYQNADMPDDGRLDKLKSIYNNDIMKKLAQHLLDEFAWATKVPEPLHAFFERTVAKEAALAIHELASELVNAPQDKDKIQALYIELQKHKAILKDKYLFSIDHSSPRNVIHDAIDAIASLNIAPHCDLEFQNTSHDKAVSEYQLDVFRGYLSHTSPYFFKAYDPTLEHLRTSLLKISHQSEANPSHIVQELYEATARFSTYEAYKPYLRQLNSLKRHLQSSVKELQKKDGLKQDPQESLLADKTAQFATLLNVNPEQVRIQSGSNGIQSYIELQIEDAPLQEGFTGYQSSYMGRIEAERLELQLIRTAFEAHKQDLLDLSDVHAVAHLPTTKRPGFERLFRLKELLSDDWNNPSLERHELPYSIQDRLKHVDALRHLDWNTQSIDLSQLKTFLGKEANRQFLELIEEQSSIAKEIQTAQTHSASTAERVEKQKREIQEIEQAISTATERRKQSDCSYSEGASLWAQMLYNQHRKLPNARYQLTHLEQTLFDFKEAETESIEYLKTHNQAIDKKRLEFIAYLIEQIKLDLGQYLSKTSKQQIDAIEKELREANPALDKIAQAEQKKSRYQTRRFFKTSELLHFEARLLHEEELIAKAQASLNEHSSESSSDNSGTEPVAHDVVNQNATPQLSNFH
ncbi:MAG: hypothetical protein ACRCXC_13525 [Legionella sp.]